MNDTEKEGKRIDEFEQLSFDVARSAPNRRPKTKEYDEFVKKFDPKKTTDDCYTPENIYNAVAEWVARKYGVDRQQFIRPFWPGGDYESLEYPAGCVVVDNPPFSIITKITRFFTENGIRFFLFGPTLTLLSACVPGKVCAIPCGVQVTYQNGANVSTSFLTNLDEHALVTYPDLYDAVKAENDKNVSAIKAHPPKYVYPDNVTTAALAQRYAKYGVSFAVMPRDCIKIDALDAQKAAGKSVFGCGLLLSNKAAADKAAADKENVITWSLSDREKDIIRKMEGNTK